MRTSRPGRLKVLCQSGTVPKPPSQRRPGAKGTESSGRTRRGISREQVQVTAQVPTREKAFWAVPGMPPQQWAELVHEQQDENLSSTESAGDNCQLSHSEADETAPGQQLHVGKRVQKARLRD